MLSLITLYIHLSALLLNQEFAEHEDSFELARWFSALKDRSRAIRSFEKGVLETKQDDDGLMVKFHLANEHKKNRNLWGMAAKSWQETADIRHADLKAQSHLELAKYFEHTLKDYETALHHADAHLIPLWKIIFRKPP